MKKEGRKQKWVFVVLLIIFSLISALSVNAAGVSSPYWDENPMYVHSGDIKEFSYLLQNMVGNEDIKMQVSLEVDSGIMQFAENKSIYDVPLRSSDVPVKMIVTIPENAKPGDEWEVGVRFTTVSSNTEGKAVVIGSAFSKGFKIIVEEPKPEEVSGGAVKDLLSSKELSFIILLAVLIILVLVVKYFYKKKSK